MICDFGILSTKSHGDVSITFRNKLRGALLAICDCGTSSSCSKNKLRGTLLATCNFGEYSFNKNYMWGTLLAICDFVTSSFRGHCLPFASLAHTLVEKTKRDTACDLGIWYIGLEEKYGARRAHCLRFVTWDHFPYSKKKGDTACDL